MMLRILSGKYARKKIECPPEDITRPTSGKVREAIFNRLQNMERRVNGLEQDVVLDAFAGSGILGLEALSRGASRSYFFEQNPKVLKILNQNIASVGAQEQAFPMGVDALNPKSAPERCSLVFLDPPYGKGLVEKTMRSLMEKGWIGQETLIVIEYASKESLQLPPSFESFFHKKYGNTKIQMGRLL